MTTADNIKPEVSVVVATHLGDRRIVRALESLVAQTLPADQFEVVLVLNGPACPTGELVDEFRGRHPGHRIRTVTTSRPGASNARNIGTACAMGRYLTFMDDDDYLSPQYLQVLLSVAGDGVVPVAYIADVPEGQAPDGPTSIPRNYFNDVILPHAGKVVPVEVVPAVLSPNVAKLIPTSVARAVEYSADLRSGEDFVYWTEIFARTRFMVHVTDSSANALYFRTVRAGSISRQAPEYDFLVSQRLDCIEALGRVAADDHVVERVVRGKAVAQAQQIGGFLRAHPQRRAEVLADIRQRRLGTFPYGELTRGRARDLAILYCFAPYQDTSALVASRRIRERGEVVDVITNKLDRVRKTDDWSASITAGYVDRVVTLQTPQYMGSWEAIRRFVEGSLEQIAQLESVKGPYRSVYSRTMWPASHFAAAAYKLRNPQAHWIAEFSDPMLHDIKGEARPDAVKRDDLAQRLLEGVAASGHAAPATELMWEWVEWVAYALADEIVFTNENQRDYMLGYCADAALRQRALNVSRVAMHPTLPPSFYHEQTSAYALDQNVKNIAYFGVFYATRGLTEVVDALTRLSSGERRKIHFHLFTDKPQEAELEFLAKDLGDVVTVNPYVPFLEFLNLTTRFDVLLVNDAATRGHHPVNPYLPSKLSDYLGSGRKIWSIVEEGSVLSRSPVAYQSRLGDADGALDVLTRIAGQRQTESSPHPEPGHARGAGHRSRPRTSAGLGTGRH